MDRMKERVVNGVVKWKPSDKVAARVVAPAAWLCKDQSDYYRDQKAGHENTRKLLERQQKEFDRVTRIIAEGERLKALAKRNRMR